MNKVELVTREKAAPQPVPTVVAAAASERPLAPRAVKFDIADDDVAFSVDPKINDWVRKENSHRVEHVCVTLAIRHHQ